MLPSGNLFALLRKTSPNSTQFRVPSYLVTVPNSGYFPDSALTRRGFAAGHKQNIPCRTRGRKHDTRIVKCLGCAVTERSQQDTIAK